MNICKECGVELDDDMMLCPLCETPVLSAGTSKDVILQISKKEIPQVRKKNLLQLILWQITAVLLLSGIAATLIINLSIQGSITWSIYPMSICLMVFSYASLMVLWRTTIFFQVLAAWIISTLVLVMVNWSIEADWPLLVALPILSAVNIIGLLIKFIVMHLKAKGLNVLSLIFVSIAVLCLIIEGIISFYFIKVIELRWSVIVAACLLPVTAAILFMYFRTKNNTDFQKIFHT
jgi:hypothetical protein